MAAAAERRGPGLIWSLVGAMLLAGVGFGLGLGVGASWEDPDLLVTALAGERRSLALPEPTPEARVAAPPPLGSRDPETVPAVSAPPSEASAGSAASAPVPPEPPAAHAGEAPAPGSAPSAGFSVQVGAFSDRSAAGGLEQRLEEGGLPTFVTGAAGQGPQRWRVRVGPVSTRDEAERLAGRLKREHGRP